MPSVFYLTDDTTPATGLTFGPTDAGDTSGVQTLHYWYNKGTPGGLAAGLKIQAIDPGTDLDSGVDWLDETWLVARVNGGDNPGSDPGFTTITTQWTPLGPGRTLALPDLPGNCAYYLELKLHPPMRDGAPTETVNFELRAIYNEPELSGDGEASELITLDTGAAFTDSTLDLLPADSIIKAVAFRVDTTVATAASYTIGDPTTAARFTTSQSGGQLTAGATGVGLEAMQGSVATDDAGPVQSAADQIRITCNTTPSAGKILVTVHYEKFVAPAA